MNDLKKKTNELVFYAESDNFQQAWEHLRKFIVIDDLNVFLREKYATNQLPYVPEYVYNEHFDDVDYMFVTVSENKLELDILNTIIKKAGITKYYRTSYLKHSGLTYYKEDTNLSMVINNEIKIIKPKFVVFFGLPIATWSLDILKRHEVMTKINTQVLATSSLLDLASTNINDQQKLTIKNLIWKDVHSDMPF